MKASLALSPFQRGIEVSDTGLRVLPDVLCADSTSVPEGTGEAICIKAPRTASENLFSPSPLGGREAAQGGSKFHFLCLFPAEREMKTARRGGRC